MICDKCGRKNENNKTKCKHCGSKLKKVTIDKSITEINTKSNKMKKLCIIFNTISFLTTILAIFVCLFGTIPLISLIFAILAVHYSIKSQRLFRVSVATISISSAVFAIDIYNLIMVLLTR